MVTCTSCGAGSVPNPTMTQCLCQPGLYLGSYSECPNNAPACCLSCPKGADCSASGNLKATIPVASGFWRQSDSSFDFEPYVYLLRWRYIFALRVFFFGFFVFFLT